MHLRKKWLKDWRTCVLKRRHDDSAIPSPSLTAIFGKSTCSDLPRQKVRRFGPSPPPQFENPNILNIHSKKSQNIHSNNEILNVPALAWIQKKNSMGRVRRFFEFARG